MLPRFASLTDACATRPGVHAACTSSAHLGYTADTGFRACHQNPINEQVPTEVVVADTTPPGLAPVTQATAWAAPAATTPGLCNADLPGNSTLARFLWVVDYFAQNGFYIVLDNQFNLDQTVLKDQAQWLQRARGPPLRCMSSHSPGFCSAKPYAATSSSQAQRLRRGCDPALLCMSSQTLDPNLPMLQPCPPGRSCCAGRDTQPSAACRVKPLILTS